MHIFLWVSFKKWGRGGTIKSRSKDALFPGAPVALDLAKLLLPEYVIMILNA